MRNGKTLKDRLEALGFDPSKGWGYAAHDALGLLERVLGPRCPDEDCADYDGEHPYHSSAMVKAHEAGQSKVCRDHARLHELLDSTEAQVASLIHARDRVRDENQKLNEKIFDQEREITWLKEELAERDSQNDR